MSHVDYSRQGCKHLCCVEMDSSVAAVDYVCCSYVAGERERGKRKEGESKQINVSALLPQ